MPHPRRRLDLLLIPTDPERDLPEGFSLDQLEAAPTLVKGGFRTMRLDRRDEVAFWSNHQGGFRAWCSRCKQLVTAAFSRSITAWRSGAPRRMPCPVCDHDQALEDFQLRPEGGFARWALVLSDVGSADVDEAAIAQATEVLGPLRIVLRRVG